MIGLQAGLVRFVFIFGSPDIIPAACKDAGFGGKLHGNSSISMGDEVEFSLVIQQALRRSRNNPPHIVFLQPIILMKIKYFVGLPESQLHEIRHIYPCFMKQQAKLSYYYCGTIIVFFLFLLV